MTKQELIKVLEPIPDNTELFLVHPLVQGALIPCSHATSVLAGINRASILVHPALHLVELYPDSHAQRQVVLLDWMDANLRLNRWPKRP